MGSEVRHVVTHRYSLGFFPPMGVGRKRDFKRSVISPGVRCWSGAPSLGGTKGAANGGSNQDGVVPMLLEMKSGWQRRTSLRRMWTSEST